METLEEMQARHRKEQRDLQSRITSKKKNATKKTRKGVNEECAGLERDLKERQESELDALAGGGEQQQEEDNEEPNGAAEQNTITNGTQSRGDAETDTKHITDKLKKTTVSFDLAPPSELDTQTQPQEQGGGGGKKRNRQKDRLARRAAERESAAVAAEQEARTMTDHRGLERSALERAFSAHGLVEHEIAPDGHCLFSAVADQLAQQNMAISPSPSLSSLSSSSITSTSDSRNSDSRDGRDDKTPPYRVVRRVATEYMEKHPDGFAPFLEEPLESYVPRIRDTAEWGGQLELLALASAYQVEIKVVQDGRTETIEPGGGGGGGAVDRKTIWLAYYRHGYGLGEHYNSLRKR
ncbi:OTU domain-containing protein 6B [Xylaria sp. FL0933]|nr:OTU domain-containing protein 6B [Xylaria sp. FL0933]